MTTDGRPPATPEGDLDRLLAGLCDGTLSDAEQRELTERIATDRAARREYLAYVDLHASLVGGLPGAMPVRAPAVGRETSGGPAAHGAWGPPRTGRRAWGAALVAASLALVAVAAWRLLRTADEAGPPLAAPPGAPQEGEPFASAGRLIDLDGGGEWIDSDGVARPAFAGDPLRAGYALQTRDDGLAVIALEDGTRLELSAAARLRLPQGEREDGLRFALEAGLLQADVRPRPAERPLVVVTSQAEVVVLGTQFCVSAAGPAATGIETETGLVRVRRVGDGRSVEVPAGHFTVARRESAAFDVRRRAELPVTLRATFDVVQARGMGFTADGDRLTVVTSRTFSSLDAATGRPRYEPRALANKSEVFVVSGSGRRILTHGRGAAVGFYDAETGETPSLTRFRTDERTVWACSRDADVAVYGFNGREPADELTIWDPYAGRAVAALAVEGAVTAAAVSDDGKYAAAGIAGERAGNGGPTREQRLQLWNLPARESLATIEVAEQPLPLLCFSPDGTRLAGATRHGAVFVWDVPSGRIVAKRDGANGWTLPVFSSAFSADGRRLALGLANGCVRLWDLAEDRELGAFRAGKHPVCSLAFSPDGGTLATCVLRGSVTLWKLP